MATGWWNSTSTTAGATPGQWNQWTTIGTAHTTETGAISTAWNYWVTDNSLFTRPYDEEEYRERERQRVEAEERAEKILVENLDEVQRRTYAEHKVVPITTARGRKYIIKKGRAGNVYRIDEHGREVEKFCIHPEEAVPDQDCMLGQLLWLRWMEEDFLRIANMTRLAA